MWSGNSLAIVSHFLIIFSSHCANNAARLRKFKYFFQTSLPFKSGIVIVWLASFHQMCPGMLRDFFLFSQKKKKIYFFYPSTKDECGEERVKQGLDNSPSLVPPLRATQFSFLFFIPVVSIMIRKHFFVLYARSSKN